MNHDSVYYAALFALSDTAQWFQSTQIPGDRRLQTLFIEQTTTLQLKRQREGREKDGEVSL